MGFRLIRLVVIGALLTGAGVHLAILQTYAWTTMALQNLRSSGIIVAVANTFDGRHPCHVCLKVKKSSESPAKRDVQMPDTKLDLFFKPSNVAGTVPVLSWGVPAFKQSELESFRQIDLPPPRNLQA